MMKKNFLRRLKAAIVGAAMIATTFAAPAMSSISTVTAATKEGSVPYTFTADGVKDGGRQANITLTKAQQNAKKLTLNFTTESKANGTVAVYGFGTTEKPYWEDAKVEVKSGGKSSFSVSVDVPTALQGKINKVGVGIWYPEDDSKWTLKSIDADSTTTPDIPDGPSSLANLKSSGTSEVVDNGDGTATISATLSAKYKEVQADGTEKVEFDFPLTLRASEDELYAPGVDADGNLLPSWKEGDPINSHKFKFRNFGIDDLNDTLRFKSFEYVIKSDDYDMSEIQYGGGINVKPGSDADTEVLKKNKDGSFKKGYWYNDQGEEDMTAYEFKIEPHGSYTETNLGGYAKVTWEVPEAVQPYVDFSGADNSVGFQYWWGNDATKDPDPETGVSEIQEIHLLSCVATYTRTVTVPINRTITQTPNSTVAMGDSIKYDLSELGLKDRDIIHAIRFTFNSAEALAQFEGGLGISVDKAKISDKAEGVDENGWYSSKNVAVINTDGKFEIMWIIPESIKKGIYTGEDGNVMIGYWYGDKEGGTTVDSVSIPKVEYFVYESQEDDLTIKDNEGNTLEDQVIDLKVGETYQIDTNVEGCVFETSRETVATVDETGLITAIDEGVAKITITTPEGQTATFTINVTGGAVTTPAITTTVTTTSKPTTTTTAKTTSPVTTTTVDPDTVVDWSMVLYGDVNVDGRVTLADVVALAKYRLSDTVFPLKNATAMENADVVYDHAIETRDTSLLSEYNLKNKTIDDLGPKDKSKVTRVPYFDPSKDSQF